MAKTFYDTQEVCTKLGFGEEDLKGLVRAGKLREFRDAGKFNYKVDEVDRLAAEMMPAGELAGSAVGGTDAGASASGEIVLEPIDDSSIELGGSGMESGLGSDILGLADTGAGGTSSGTQASDATKGDTVVASVGVNVFDDDELDEHVDPLAQTAVTDIGGLGLEGLGSGSGILDLTRESDDTSLGKELLDEIYTDADEKEADDAAGDTKAGLTEGISAAEDGAETGVPGTEAGARPSRGAVVREVVEHAPDAVTTSLTAVMVVAVVVMWVAGLGTAALVQGVMPSLLQAIYAKLWMFSLGALVAAGMAGAATYLVAKKRGG